MCCSAEQIVGKVVFSFEQSFSQYRAPSAIRLYTHFIWPCDSCFLLCFLYCVWADINWHPIFQKQQQQKEHSYHEMLFIQLTILMLSSVCDHQKKIEQYFLWCVCIYLRVCASIVHGKRTSLYRETTKEFKKSMNNTFFVLILIQFVDYVFNVVYFVITVIVVPVSRLLPICLWIKIQLVIFFFNSSEYSLH